MPEVLCKQPIGTLAGNIEQLDGTLKRCGAITNILIFSSSAFTTKEKM